MKDFGRIFYMIIGKTLDDVINESMFPNLKCSINEITEKTDVTKEEILILLEKGILKGKIIFGVPYILGLSAYGVKNELKKMLNRAENNEN